MGEFLSRELTRSRKIYYFSGNLSCLFFCDLLWEMTSSTEE